MPDEIEQMELLIGELRTLLEDFDLGEHNDEGNEDHVQMAVAGLDQVAAAVSDLVP